MKTFNTEDRGRVRYTERKAGGVVCTGSMPEKAVRRILNERCEEAYDKIDRFTRMFGPDHYVVVAAEKRLEKASQSLLELSGVA